MCKKFHFSADTNRILLNISHLSVKPMHISHKNNFLKRNGKRKEYVINNDDS